jgi:predicted 3-demethylubiquinone-9 3-methyltransferase (glyoxalase superfamily)
MSKITPFLWFDNQAEEAANFYVSVFKDSKLNGVTRYGAEAAKVGNRPEGSAMTASFTLGGLDFTALNGGPLFEFNESISFVITCKDQDEIDYYWDKLSAVPESEQCGWLKDKYGVSWQVIPENLGELLNSPESMAAMLKMKKFVIEELRAA